MYIIRCLRLLWLIPISWLDAILVRKKPFEERYAHMVKWSYKFLSAFKMKLEVEQTAPLPEDAAILFVSNHQSEFDMFMLFAGINYPFTFISKVENKKVPYVGSWSKTLELIFFDRDDQGSAIHMLREAARRLKSKKNLLIFPEGTRAKGTQMHEMHAGSLQPAYLAKSYIVPVVLVNSYKYLDLIKHKGSCKVRILKPLSFQEYKAEKAENLIKVLQEQMQDILNEQ